MKIKVCGMRDAENISELALLRPDYMGFIFYPRSARFAGEMDPAVVASVPANIKKTGVFVDSSHAEISEAIAKYSLDAVQLHGSESPALCEKLREKGVEVIKAFGIHEEFDFSLLGDYEEKVDFFLFDTQTKSHGGSGRVFNWDILKQYPLCKPYFLSGGLSLENLPAVNELDDERLYAVDLNSCFESGPAVKDIGLLRRAVQLLRREA